MKRILLFVLLCAAFPYFGYSQFGNESPVPYFRYSVTAGMGAISCMAIWISGKSVVACISEEIISLPMGSVSDWNCRRVC